MEKHIQISYEKQKQGGVIVALHIDGSQNCFDVLQAINGAAKDFERRFFERVKSRIKPGMADSEIEAIASRISSNELDACPDVPAIALNTGANA